MSSILDTVLLEYESIAQAPTMAELEKQARDEKIGLQAKIMMEREKRYKSVDRFGVVFLIQNPAVWETDPVRKAKIMPTPIKQGKIQDLTGDRSFSSNKLHSIFTEK
jgi:hypothetical protein